LLLNLGKRRSIREGKRTFTSGERKRNCSPACSTRKGER